MNKYAIAAIAASGFNRSQLGYVSGSQSQQTNLSMNFDEYLDG